MLNTYEKGFELNLNPADNVNIYERYMIGTIDGNIEKLFELISENLKGYDDNGTGFR